MSGCRSDSLRGDALDRASQLSESPTELRRHARRTPNLTALVVQLRSRSRTHGRQSREHPRRSVACACASTREHARMLVHIIMHTCTCTHAHAHAPAGPAAAPMHSEGNAAPRCAQRVHGRTSQFEGTLTSCKARKALGSMSSSWRALPSSRRCMRAGAAVSAASASAAGVGAAHGCESALAQRTRAAARCAHPRRMLVELGARHATYLRKTRGCAWVCVRVGACGTVLPAAGTHHAQSLAVGGADTREHAQSRLAEHAAGERPGEGRRHDGRRRSGAWSRSQSWSHATTREQA